MAVKANANKTRTESTVQNSQSRARKKVKRVVVTGVVYINASYNNTRISIGDVQGNIISWATAGGSGFRGSKKSTPYAAQIAAGKAGLKAKEFGLRSVDVRVDGFGPGRESAIRKVGEFFKITAIFDVTGIPHNGCRPEKERRV